LEATRHCCITDEAASNSIANRNLSHAIPCPTLMGRLIFSHVLCDQGRYEKDERLVGAWPNLPLNSCRRKEGRKEDSVVVAGAVSSREIYWCSKILSAEQTLGTSQNEPEHERNTRRFRDASVFTILNEEERIGIDLRDPAGVFQVSLIYELVLRDTDSMSAI
jgi:hypothetical protein